MTTLREMAESVAAVERQTFYPLMDFEAIFRPDVIAPKKPDQGVSHED